MFALSAPGKHTERLCQSFWCPADALELHRRSELDWGRERLDEASAGL